MRLLSAALAAGLSLDAVTAPAQIPAIFTNLQVQPKDIPRGQLINRMKAITGDLGVRCTYCHVGPDDLTGMDFATDEKRTKRVAREMMRMVDAINGEHLAALPPGDTARETVTCYTCHRGEAKPARRQ